MCTYALDLGMMSGEDDDKGDEYWEKEEILEAPKQTRESHNFKIKYLCECVYVGTEDGVYEL